MLTVGQLKKVLATLSDDLGCYAYEGEVTGIIFVGTPVKRHDGGIGSPEYGYVKTTESWDESSDGRLLKPDEH